MSDYAIFSDQLTAERYRKQMEKVNCLSQRVSEIIPNLSHNFSENQSDSDDHHPILYFRSSPSQFFRDYHALPLSELDN